MNTERMRPTAVSHLLSLAQLEPRGRRWGRSFTTATRTPAKPCLLVPSKVPSPPNPQAQRGPALWLQLSPPREVSSIPQYLSPPCPI